MWDAALLGFVCSFPRGQTRVECFGEEAPRGEVPSSCREGVLVTVLAESALSRFLHHPLALLPPSRTVSLDLPESVSGVDP